MLPNVEERRCALARMLDLHPALVSYKEQVNCFVVRPLNGFHAISIYWVFTPAEAETKRELDQLHRRDMADFADNGRPYLIFVNRTPATQTCDRPSAAY